MDLLGTLGPVDAAALAILGVAALRGLWIGAVREAFSLAAVAAAFIAVRTGTDPLSTWLLEQAPAHLSPLAARILAGAALAFGTLFVVGSLGRVLRRGLQAAGLGLLDRIGGGALGLAEGALVVAVALSLASAGLGRNHPGLADSRALSALDAARNLVREAPPPDVAAPPPGRHS